MVPGGVGAFDLLVVGLHGRFVWVTQLSSGFG